MARPTDLESEQQQQQEQQQHELLSLHTFEQGDFDVSALVSSLTEQAGPASNGSTAFDPAPLASTFESAVDALLPLRDRISTRSSEAERAVSSAERAYTSKLTELKSNFEAVQSSFTSLESRISQVGQSAIRIGDQLESIDRLKARASDASDLIRHYFAFSRGDTSSLEAVRKQGGRDGRAKVAVLARRLLAVARDVEGQMGSSGTGEQTRDAVEKYCEKFEKDMLKLFDRYYRNGDPRGMAVGVLTRCSVGCPPDGVCVCVCSTAQRRCWSSMAGSPVSRCMSTSTTTLSPKGLSGPLISSTRPCESDPYHPN